MKRMVFLLTVALIEITISVTSSAHAEPSKTSISMSGKSLKVCFKQTPTSPSKWQLSNNGRCPSGFQIDSGLNISSPASVITYLNLVATEYYFGYKVGYQAGMSVGESNGRFQCWSLPKTCTP